MNDFTVIAVSIVLGALLFVAVPKNKLYGEWSARQRLFGACLGTLFLAGAILILGTRFVFFLPKEQRTTLLLLGLALVLSSIAIGYLAGKLRRP